jgi:hypothetical protein
LMLDPCFKSFDVLKTFVIMGKNDINGGRVW